MITAGPDSPMLQSRPQRPGKGCAATKKGGRMPGELNEVAAARHEIESGLAHYTAAMERAHMDEELLALRDGLLDLQFSSRQIITTIEERLGAFEGDDSPRALAAQSEELIEQIEGLQDAWESRVDQLLEAGFADDRLPTFFTELLARPDRDTTLSDLFTGLPADMDQAAELLDYAKRYLLSLVVPPPKRT